MRYEYNEYVKQVFKLSKVNFKRLFKDVKQYADYTLINYKELRKSNPQTAQVAGRTD